jgi:GTP-binding protein EngB required for normal cell division
LLIDSRRGLQNEELQLIRYLQFQRREVCPVLTKADKLSRIEGSESVKKTSEILKSLGPGIHFPILHSSINKTGNDLLWRWIFERIQDESK